VPLHEAFGVQTVQCLAHGGARHVEQTREAFLTQARAEQEFAREQSRLQLGEDDLAS